MQQNESFQSFFSLLKTNAKDDESLFILIKSNLRIYLKLLVMKLLMICVNIGGNFEGTVNGLCRVNWVYGSKEASRTKLVDKTMKSEKAQLGTHPDG